MQDVDGKVAVITGAADGIGRGMAQAFTAAGMKVVLGDIDTDALHRTAQELQAIGADVHPVSVDVSRHEQVAALAAATLQKYGAVHVLCNNAGVLAGSSPSWLSTPEDWQWILGVNLMGVVHGVRTFLPIMIQQGTPAHIVNTASMSGLASGGGNSLYTVSKFGVVAFSESLHFELLQGRLQPKVSVLCPAFVDTDFANSYRHRPADATGLSPADSTPLSQAMRKWLNEQLKQGLPPRVIGEEVLAAIREERFYVITHREWDAHIEQRLRHILDGTNPTPLPFPKEPRISLHAGQSAQR